MQLFTKLQKSCSVRINRYSALFALLASSALVFFATACTRRQPVVIWTDRAELVSYVELFNAQQSRTQAVVVYKKQLVDALPPAADEQAPDLVIGSWLKNAYVKKNFTPLNALFTAKDLQPDSLYEPLLSYGKVDGKQYLLPISFNLPVVIFSVRNAERIPDNYMLSVDEIRDTAALFNTKNESDVYTHMGFAPSWEPEFLYAVAKLNGTHFKEQGSSFNWNQASLDKTVAYIKDWTTQVNGSTNAEQDFAFKYLYTPKYRQVDSGRCLFAYSTSSRLFSISYEQLGSIDFRWIQQNEQIPVEDNIVMAGLYSHSANTAGTKYFLLWFVNEQTQKALLERTEAMHLNTASFGIAGGFSSLRDVNERLFPLYYQTLLGNLPAEASIQAPHSFPSRWTNLKERIVIPYLEEATRTDGKKSVQSLDSRIDTWARQFD